MQVDPIKPALRGTGTKRLTLNYFQLLSNCPFKINLRRSIEAEEEEAEAKLAAEADARKAAKKAGTYQHGTHDVNTKPSPRHPPQCTPKQPSCTELSDIP